MSDKRMCEVALAKEALVHLGVSARSVCPCDPPCPDVSATLDCASLIGIEVTHYHSGPVRKTGSPGRRFASNWLEVQGEIRRRVERHPHLRHITGFVAPQHGRPLPGGGDARALGCELVELAAEALRENRQPLPISLGRPFSERYPLMNKHVAELALRPIGAAQWVSWGCMGLAGGFGLDIGSLMALIGKKEQKNYDWRGANEWWLLIAAGAAPATVSSWAGDESVIAEELNSLDLSSVTAFDRVLFLEHSFGWAREVWHNSGLPALQSRPRP
jgi:hypothetical protein